MKRFNLPKLTPAFAALAGIAAMFIRKGLYTSAVDATGRIVTSHPLNLGLAALTGIVVAVCLLSARSQEGEGDYESNFSQDTNAVAGCFFFAFGILFTVLTGDAPMAGTLGLIWKVLGIVSALSLAVVGYCRMFDKAPPVAACVALPLFLTAHLINHYQLWCSNPQIQDVFFPLFATITLTITAYQQAAFSADMGNRRQMLACGCLAVYLCLAQGAVVSHPTLYISGVLWAGNCLCRWKAV